MDVLVAVVEGLIISGAVWVAVFAAIDFYYRKSSMVTVLEVICIAIIAKSTVDAIKIKLGE